MSAVRFRLLLGLGFHKQSVSRWTANTNPGCSPDSPVILVSGLLLFSDQALRRMKPCPKIPFLGFLV
jgi:hypothetical protein